MQEETVYKINNRYKQTHVAEDIGVTNAQMSRFLNDNKVSEDFYIKWFNWYGKNQ
jgi:plasmid maintenance system antidote protein VapI